MAQPSSQIPTRITIAAGVIFSILALWVNILAQAPSEVFGSTKEIAVWFVAIASFVAIFWSIGYGFLKKQKYDNIKKESDEWQGLAESRAARIAENNEKHLLEISNLQLKLQAKDTRIRNLDISNEAVVSQNLQMKAILKELRLSGQWQGHEEKLHLDQ